MGWLDSLRSAFSFLGVRSRGEDAMAEYVIREHHRGRALAEILDDPYVVNRCTRAQIERLLDRPAIVRAVGEDMIDRTRTERAAT